MKVKSYFAIIIIVCLSCGLLLELIITAKQSKYQAISNKVIIDQFTLDELKRFEQELSRYLINVDTIFAIKEPTLIQGTLNQGKSLIEQMHNYEKNTQSALHKELIAKTKSDLVLINDLINTTNNIDQYHVVSIQLKLTIADLIKEASALLSNRKNILATEKDQLTRTRNIGLCIFGAILLYLWAWGYKKVCNPIQKLKKNAEASMHNLEEFKGIKHGPREVIELSKSLTSLTSALSYQASHDKLTDLPNRREFERKLKNCISDLKQNKQKSYDILCYLDLDKFKIINDACGHDAGDEFLVIIANLIKTNIRKADFMARIGSDEFCIILYKCDLNTAIDLCTKVRDEIENVRYEWEERSFRTSTSIGLLEIKDDNLSVHDVLNISDTTCSVAKELGGNRLHIFNAEDIQFTRKKSEMSFVNRIYTALEENRFLLYRQDIVPLAHEEDGEHFEILLRLLTREGKIISPNEFLPAVERYRLATQLDQWVVTNTFKILSSDSYNLADLEICNINLSGQSFSNLHMADFIVEKLLENHIPAHKICFEITETAAVTDIDNAQKFITRLKSHGCLFALDDFGSGFSSFQYLKSLPVDFIKIDGSFIQNIATDRFDQTTVNSINQIAKAIGQQTVAEFVDSIEVIEKLKEIGIDYAQGYYFDQPVLLSEESIDTKISARI